MDIEVEADSGNRMRLMREALGYPGHGGSTRFAALIGVSKNLWSMVETGTPVSKRVARLIRSQHPEISLEYLLEGKPGQMSLDTLVKLGVIKLSPSTTRND